MKSIIISTLVGFFILTLSFQASGEEWTTEQKEVWEAIKEYHKYIENGDVDSAMALIHENALDLNYDNPLPLKKNQILSWNLFWSRMKPTIEIKPISIAIINDKLATAFYHFKWKSRDEIYSNKGRFGQTFIKQNGKWISIGSNSCSCSNPMPCPYGW
jgi:hypothetical protein